MRLKKYKHKKNKFVNKMIFIVILLIVSIIYIFKIFNEKALPQFISYSEIETKKIVSNIISNTVTQEITNNINMDDLFITLKDSNGDIQSIDFNSNEVNKILVNSSKSVEQNLKYLEKGEVDKLNLSNYDNQKLKNGIIYELPSGIIFNNTLLSNILPKIPIKMSLIGNVLAKLTTSVDSYGINNALIKVNINIEAEVKILMPFVSSNTILNVDVPIIMKIMEGSVPSYYFGGYLDTIVSE
ncbi:MAG: sporulation protein YunB [Bacilli bacterium]|nr:sporulation protein YunB [Bacilli bacterium]